MPVADGNHQDGFSDREQSRDSRCGYDRRRSYGDLSGSGLLLCQVNDRDHLPIFNPGEHIFYFKKSAVVSSVWLSWFWGCNDGLRGSLPSDIAAFFSSCYCLVVISPIDNKQIIKSVLYFFVPLILVILPWTVRNYRVLSEVVPVTSSGGANLYLANNTRSTGGLIGYRELMKTGIFHLGEDEDEIEYNRYYRDKALSFIENNPDQFIRLAFKRLLWFYHLDYHYKGNLVLVLFFHLLLVLAVIGVWLSRHHWRKTILLGMVILNFTVVHMIFLPAGRYRLPIVPFLLAFAAIPVFRVVRHCSFNRESRKTSLINRTI